MSDVILLLFMVIVFVYTGYVLSTAKPTDRWAERARRRRTNDVWKDRGILK